MKDDFLAFERPDQDWFWGPQERGFHEHYGELGFKLDWFTEPPDTIPVLRRIQLVRPLDPAQLTDPEEIAVAAGGSTKVLVLEEYITGRQETPTASERQCATLWQGALA